MTVRGNACKALFNAIVRSTIDRVLDWFSKHPEQKFCYWANNEFLPAEYTEQMKKDFLCRHPEIEDLSDHTTVYCDIATQCITLRTFCKKLREGIADMVADGCTGNTVNGAVWRVTPEGDNYKIIIYKQL